MDECVGAGRDERSDGRHPWASVKPCNPSTGSDLALPPRSRDVGPIRRLDVSFALRLLLVRHRRVFREQWSSADKRSKAKDATPPCSGPSLTTPLCFSLLAPAPTAPTAPRLCYRGRPASLLWWVEGEAPGVALNVADIQYLLLQTSAPDQGPVFVLRPVNYTVGEHLLALDFQ